jgi:hypothetical protein
MLFVPNLAFCCVKKTYCADKKDVALYSEKVVNMKFQPSLSQYGGKPVDGLIVITATETVSYLCCMEQSVCAACPVNKACVIMAIIARPTLH